MWDPVILDRLTGILEQEVSDLTAGAIAAVGGIGPTAFGEALFLALAGFLFHHRTFSDPAITAVRQMGPKALARLLQEVAVRLGDEGTRERKAAVRVLQTLRGAAGTPEHLNHLLRLLHHTDPRVREAAARGAEHLGRDGATPTLLDALTLLQADADPGVRYHAGEALYTLSPRGK